MSKAEIINVEESEVQVTVDVIAPLDIQEIEVTTALEPPYITGTPLPGQLAEWVDATHLQGIPDIAAFIVGPGPFPGKLAVFVDDHHIRVGQDEGSVVHAAPPTNFTQLAGFADPTDGTLIQGVDLPAAGLKRVGPVLILTDDLNALENLTGTNTIYYRSGVSAWSSVTIGAGLSFAAGTLLNTTLSGNNIWTGSNFFNPGPVVVGHTAVIDAGTYKLQTHGLDTGLNTGVYNWGSAAGGFGYHLNKSKSGTIGTHAAVVDADILGQLQFRGSDGTAFNAAANITSTVEGAVASGSVPGKLTFNTRRAGGALTQRLLIDSAGRVIAGPSATAVGGLLSVVGALSVDATFTAECYQSGITGAQITLRHSRGPAVGQITSLQLNDMLGTISFEGADSVPSMTSNGAAIMAMVDAALGTNHIPSRLTFWTDNGTAYAERMRLTNAGMLNIFLGGAAPPTTFASALLGIAGTAGANAQIIVENYQNAPGQPSVNLRHSRGAYGAQGALLAVDPIGVFTVWGSDGTNFISCGAVQFSCESAPTAGRVPTRIGFLTDNGTNYTERVRIYASGGFVLDPNLADPGTQAGAAHAWVVRQTVDSGIHGFFVYNVAADAIGKLYINANKHLEVLNAGIGGFQVFVSNDDVNAVATFLTSGVAIKGTNTNDDAATGFVGQYKEAVSQITIAVTAATGTNLATLSLEAGDWDLELRVPYNPTGSVACGVEIEVSTTSATVSGVIGNSYVNQSFPALSGDYVMTCRRLKLASTSNVFAVIRASVGGNAGVHFWARRRR